MKKFTSRLSNRIDEALQRYENARGLARLYWRVRLYMLEREAFA